jgi:hypothetical protein
MTKEARQVALADVILMRVNGKTLLKRAAS